MGGVVNDGISEADRLELAEAAYQRLLTAVSLIEQSSPAVLREIRESLEVEIMIDRGGRARRRLLRLFTDFCDQRIRDKERGRSAGAPADRAPGTLRTLMSGRRNRPAPPGGMT